MSREFSVFWAEMAIFGSELTSTIKHLQANSLRIGAGNF
jgi:hypothetical protein